MTFWKVPSPWAKPLATPGQPFGVGDYLVGSEIAPGTYTAQVRGDPSTCGWARVRDFQGTANSVIEQHPPTKFDFETPTVTIQPSEYGFSSQGQCGTWVKTG